MKSVAIAAGALALLVTSAAGAAPAIVLKPEPQAKIVRADSALDAVIAPGAVMEKVATGFVFVEGPMWHNGALWFSDLRGNKMYSVTPDGKLKVLLDHSGGLPSFPAGANGGSNAMVPDQDGTVLMDQHGARRIVRIGADMKLTPFLEKYEGKRFNSPNDMVFAQDGALWFTDPPYGLYDPANPNKDLDKDPAKELKFNAVWRYKDGKLAPVITDLPRPNGIGFSPDGKVLYIANSEPQALVLRYDVGANGKVSNRKVIADFTKDKGIGVPDGLKVDSQGNLWASGQGGIRIFSPQGKLLGQIQLPEVAANIAFGGADGKVAYITASSSIYRLPLRIAGEKPLYAK